MADLSKIQPDLISDALHQYSDFIVGLKAIMSKTVIGNNGITPLLLAKEIQHSYTNLPLMVHIGSAPPLLKEILSSLEEGDIVTHCFNGKANGIYDHDAHQIKGFVNEYLEKG